MSINKRGAKHAWWNKKDGRTAILVLTVALTSLLGSESAFAGNTLARDQAKTIVLTFLKSKGYRTDSAKFDLEVDPDESDLKNYFLFHAYFNSDSRLVSIGSYAVDRRTAALWERLACRQLQTAALLRMQRKLRREAGLQKGVPEDTDGPCF
ncbi:MAG: hypothetical protein JSS45_05090 [Proteobacteria bacterium]|nr:hypothetical protein [Pseudomonadota bacterium]